MKAVKRSPPPRCVVAAAGIPVAATIQSQQRIQSCSLNNFQLRVFKLLSRHGHKSLRGRIIPARAPPPAINRSQRVGLINRALYYCISRHNNEVSSFGKNYGPHVGGRLVPKRIFTDYCVRMCLDGFFWLSWERPVGCRHPRSHSRWKVIEKTNLGPVAVCHWRGVGLPSPDLCVLYE